MKRVKLRIQKAVVISSLLLGGALISQGSINAFAQENVIHFQNQDDEETEYSEKETSQIESTQSNADEDEVAPCSTATRDYDKV